MRIGASLRFNIMTTHYTHYWIIVASRDHVQRGSEGGFAQACHGKASPLNRMKAGDGVIYYSSKARFGQEERCQRFTAIGRVNEGSTYTHEMDDGRTPARRNITFQPCVETSIQSLIDQLSFITDKKHWGAPFRFGFLEVPETDFRLIASAMLPDGGVWQPG